jgi:hypothetical protein
MTHRRTAEFDSYLFVRVSTAMRRRLEAAAKDDHRRVTDLARLIWEKWLEQNAAPKRETPK